ncbi:MAG: hypothetical protein NTX97_06635, partial [Bacteroidetes bacterium]|nr:hypothetical protein [Bacteroidota bacterium]
MSSFREKSQGFIIGILVGLIVAGGFFVFKLDDYFKELNFYKSVSKTFSSDKKEETPTVKDLSTPEIKEKKDKTKSVKISKEETDFENTASTKTDSIKVSIDSLTLENPNTDGIVVRKDELLSTKTIEVINLSPVAKMSSKDSLLQKVSGIKD